MANNIVQLKDKDDNNIFPVAGGMAADSITTAMLQDGAITTAKIASGAVTSDKIDFSTLTWESVQVSNYITINNAFTTTLLTAKKFGPIVCIQYALTGTIADGKTVIGSGVSGAFTETFYGAARCTGTGVSDRPATILAIPGGEVRLHTTQAGTGSAGTLWLMAD